MNALRIAFCSLLLLIATAPLMAQGTYTQIDVPGSLFTNVTGIDTAGDIIGIYVDSSDSIHGYLLSGGNYTTIDYPGATSLTLSGINDLGQIVGYTINYVGFLYDVATQTFSPVSYPHAVYTVPLAINNSGKIVGYFDLFGLTGFQSVGSTYQKITPPNAVDTYARGVSASGEVVGSAYTNTTMYNFLFLGGKYRGIGGTNLPQGSVVLAVNPAGTAVVGEFPVGSIGEYSGFLYQNKTLTTLQFPGSTRTQANGINSTGEVVGYFFDANGVGHGFMWTPSATAPKL